MQRDPERIRIHARPLKPEQRVRVINNEDQRGIAEHWDDKSLRSCSADHLLRLKGERFESLSADKGVRKP